MSIAQKLKRMVGVGQAGVEFTTFRCTDCGHEFDSARSQERVQCPECLERDVEPVA